MRKHQRWLMLIIAALTIIAFAFLYNTTEMNRVGANMVAKIYGRTVMQVDVEKAARNYQLALALGQYELVRSLAGQARSEEEAASSFIWNLMVLQHEAAALGIEPGAQEVVEMIKGLPVFQEDGRFDPVKYSNFVQQQLAPRGFSERQLEDVVRDTLRLREIKALVESPAVVFPSEVTPVLARMAPLDVVVFDFDAALAGEAAAVSDEEIQKAYEGRKDSLQAPEMRALRYVTFLVPEAETGKAETKEGAAARLAALQKTASETNDFAQALADSKEGMVAFAKRKNVEVQTTPLFDAKGGIIGKAAGSHDTGVVEAAREVAFRLPAQLGNYEIVELGQKGYAVIEVAEVKAPRQMEFEEARADLRAELIAKKRDGIIAEKAAALLPVLREKLAAGGEPAKVAAEAGLKTREIKDLNLFKRELMPEERTIAAAAADLPEGKLGDFHALSSGGGMAVYVAKRSEPNAKELAERRPMIEAGTLQGKQMLLFAQWLTDARNRSGLQMLHSTR